MFFVPPKDGSMDGGFPPRMWMVPPRWRAGSIAPVTHTAPSVTAVVTPVGTTPSGIDRTTRAEAFLTSTSYRVSSVVDTTQSIPAASASVVGCEPLGRATLAVPDVLAGNAVMARELPVDAIREMVPSRLLATQT